MDDETPNHDTGNSKSWLTTLTEGGLPQFLAGPAGKAISRLIGAAADIPSAYLEGIAQGIRDQTEARQKVSELVSMQAAEIASSNPEVMNRAVHTMLNRAYREQENKDAIAKIAIDNLQADPAPESSTGPIDDWIDQFERYASTISRDDLQLMFGKILAGEIRNPGSINSATLGFVSHLDTEAATLIQKTLTFTLQSTSVLFAIMPTPLIAYEKTVIEQSGFFSTGLIWSPELDANGIFTLQIESGCRLTVSGHKNTKIEMGDVGLISPAGKGLLNAVTPRFDVTAFCNYLVTLKNVEKVRVEKTSNCGSEKLVEELLFSNDDFEK